jgi:chloramphenicol 3-O-phosphotransferase
VTRGDASFWVVTGISASGKTTVGRLLADGFDRSAFVEGDVIRTMVRRGRIDPGPGLDAEAEAQLRLRYRHAALLADSYVDEGFTVVVEDVIVGRALWWFLEYARTRPLHVVVLAPSLDAVAAREAARTKDGYQGAWTPGTLEAVLRDETPRIGLWLDTATLTPAETVAEIRARGSESLVEV